MVAKRCQCPIVFLSEPSLWGNPRLSNQCQVPAFACVHCSIAWCGRVVCLKLNNYISVTSDPIWIIQEPFENPRYAILLHKWICDLVRWMSRCIQLRKSIEIQGGPEFSFQKNWPCSLQPVELSSWNLQVVGSICSQVTCQNLVDFATQIVHYMPFSLTAHLPVAKMLKN